MPPRRFIKPGIEGSGARAAARRLKLPRQVIAFDASTMRLMGDAPTWLDDDQQRTWQALLTVVIALPTLLDRQLQEDAGISNFEYSILARLSMADGDTMRLSDLARISDGTLPRVSKAADRLEARGWIVRLPDPSNGRYTLARLTAAGRRKVVATAPRHVARVMQLVFDPLTPTQQRNLGTALVHIAATVRRELPAG